MELINISKIKNKKILAIGAHPDDIEFGAAGTISLLAPQNTITLLIVTDGRMGTHQSDVNIQELVKTRENETRAAAKILGIKGVLFYGYPDTALSNYEKNFRKRLFKDFLKLRPDIILSFDPWGRYEPLLHPDHRVVAWAVVESVLFGTLPLYLKRRGLGKNPLDPKPQVWLTAPAEPNIAVDISLTFDKKIKALGKHISQWDKVSFERIKQRVGERTQKAGKEAGVKVAELFRILG